MRAFGGVVIVLGLIAFWVCGAILWTGYQAKRLASKQGRQEIKAEITETAKFVTTDKDFHKGLGEEFRPLLILLGVLVIAGLLSLIGLGD